MVPMMKIPVPLLVQTSKVPFIHQMLRYEILDLYGDVGTTLVLQGQLFAQDTSGCRTPISGTIDFGDVDPSGGYDNTSADMKYRGLVQTDAQGVLN